MRNTLALCFCIWTALFLSVGAGVTRVRNLGDSCTTPKQCEDLIADSVCNSGVCECKKGFDRIGDNWCESLSDAINYDLPSNKPVMICNSQKGCGSLTNCKAKYLRKLRGLRDSMKVKPGSSLYGLCGLNIELSFGTELQTPNSMYTVNTLCYEYQSDFGSFPVAEIKVKEPPRKIPNSGKPLVSCNIGSDPCNNYRFSGFVVGFHIGVPDDCLDKSSTSALVCTKWCFLLLGLVFIGQRILVVHLT